MSPFNECAVAAHKLPPVLHPGSHTLTGHASSAIDIRTTEMARDTAAVATHRFGVPGSSNDSSSSFYVDNMDADMARPLTSQADLHLVDQLHETLDTFARESQIKGKVNLRRLQALFLEFANSLNRISPHTREQILTNSVIEKSGATEIDIIKALAKVNAEAIDGAKMWSQVSFFFRAHSMSPQTERGRAQISALLLTANYFSAHDIASELKQLVSLVEQHKKQRSIIIEQLSKNVENISDPQERLRVLHKLQTTLRPLSYRHQIKAFETLVRLTPTFTKTDRHVAYDRIYCHIQALQRARLSELCNIV